MNVYRDNAKAPVLPSEPDRKPLPVVAKVEPWRFKTREQFPELMSKWGLNGVGVEVGVYRGGFSTLILREWPGVLHLVDPWEYQPDKQDLLNTPELPDNEQIARDEVRDYVKEGRCVIHKGYSVPIARNLAGPALDWVYIDALHDYDSCLADMRAWAPLTRPGGALCGHDYLDHPPGGQTDFGVVSAVRDWCLENGYDPKADVLTTTDDGYPTWVIRLRAAPAPARASRPTRRASPASAESPTDTTASPPHAVPIATPD